METRFHCLEKLQKHSSIVWKAFPPAPDGFTLVEILLVVVLIGISMGVAVPIFARSIRGARLRDSGRGILAMHQQAHAKAVLGQCYAALFFDDRLGTVELFTQADTDRSDVFFDDLGAPVASAGGVAAPGAPAAGGSSAQPVSETVRKLGDGVRIDRFEGGAEVDGIHYVQYYPNGMCEKWQLLLRDDEGREMSIAADPVTGKAAVVD
ncbi:MAG: prepilin-type N-terminal cleavage/methylation domain-containing protein [Kiritimatiellae bacterium]|nr:prepilin-type N-terminal cleavage/methylation domain-containing protein [Kiritimatiellia bacterium]